ncbi:transglutaminase domain-containing protein [Lentzea sp. DG1S-22]|uniref:transglutaminase domain-containing protein n=1 Tax=Lentzea sp. DG1S-22 TaxID=3108822 RepID=UPI002E7855AF|nr:transglutaminase domain-containing protein [Lentzea sp. DG1S-22]WVH84294.1 transglutaminase domain-containing protein [Lentzea sp. DG1S-22]
MRERLPVTLVVLAAAVAGLCFAPVFGVSALLPVIVVVAVVTGGAALLSQSLVAWRPLVVTLAGLLAVVEVLLFPTTLAGLPTGTTVALLTEGVTDSWQLTLQSTWPARPDPRLVLFVPLLVLLACVFGLEVLLRLKKPVPALTPSFAVVVLSQVFGALTGLAAVVAALAYVAVAAGVFVVSRPSNEHQSALSFLPAPLVVTAVVAVVGLLAPMPGPSYSLKQDQLVPVSARMTNPLDDVAHRRARPDAPVFSVRPSCERCLPDRWPVVVLDTYNGVTWTAGSRYRRLGSELPPPDLDVPVTRRDAVISLREAGTRWLPSQPWPAAVSGADPLVEESEGSLLAPSPLRAGVGYGLSWWEPEVGGSLDGFAIDPALGGQDGVGTPPPGVAELATEAVKGVRSSFTSALQLERFLRENYRRVDGSGGQSWPQLRRFLLDTKEGTSEQFASAYVLMARMLGIPARLVVGYRTPERKSGGEHVVHNDDVLAWPEVAVAGVGWVPLDPAGAATRGAGEDSGLTAATQKARDTLPTDPSDPPVGPGPAAQADPDERGSPFPLVATVIPVVVLLLGWLAGVPAAKWVRARRRRRGPGTAAVHGAWLEARDRLREHRVPLTAGMTPLETAAAAAGAGLPAAADGVRRLAATVDFAMWSGAEPGAQARDDAWAAVRAVRRGLRARGLTARLRAAVDPRTLRP